MTTSSRPARVRFLQLPLIALSVLVMACTPPPPPDPVTDFEFSGPQGEYLSQGLTWSYADPPSSITVVDLAPEADYQYLRVTVFDSGGTQWRLDVAGARQEAGYAFSGAPLTVGSYSDAQRAPFRDLGRNGIDLFGNGRGCNQVAGEFTLDALDVNANQVVQELDLTFTLRCEVVGPAVTGRVRFNS